MSGGKLGLLIGGGVAVIAVAAGAGLWATGFFSTVRDEPLADAESTTLPSSADPTEGTAPPSSQPAADGSATAAMDQSTAPDSASASAASANPVATQNPVATAPVTDHKLRVANMSPEVLQGDNVPNYLRGRVIYRRKVDTANPAGGLLEFDADPGAVVVLQASWKDVPLPEVKSEVTPRKELLNLGWLSLGRCPWSQEEELFYAILDDGGSFRYRTNNFQPPWPIEAAALNVRDAAEEPEIPDSAAGMLTAAAAYEHLQAEDYDWLDETAELFRSQSARHYSGNLKLDDYYDGLWSFYVGAEDAGFDAREAQLEKWRQARPASVTATIALSLLLNEYAWHARGTGFANTVTEEGGRLFRQRLTRSSELLRPLGQQGVKDPFLYQALTACALGLHGSPQEVESTVREALRIEPRYTKVLYPAVMYYLPRWYGNDEDLPKFADRIVELTSKDLGLGAYAVVVDVARSIHPKVFDDFAFSWEKAKQGFRDMMERFPHDRSWYDRTCLAAAAADDDAMITEMLALIGDQPTESLWPPDNYFRRFVLSYSTQAVSGEQKRLMRGDADPIDQFDICPDNARIVSGDARHRMFVHNVETGAKEFEVQFQDYPSAIAYSPDPTLIVIGDLHGELNLYDLRTRRTRRLGTHDKPILGVEIARDGSLTVSASKDGVVRFWDGKTGNQRHSISLEIGGSLAHIALSRDARFVAAVGGNGEVQLCNTENGQVQAKWAVGIMPSRVAISADGTRLAIATKVENVWNSDLLIAIWDVASQASIARSAPLKSVAAMAFHPSRDVLAFARSEKSFGLEGGAFLWNYTLGQDDFVQLVGHASGVHDCQFFPDGRLATCGTDGTIRIWETN